MIDNFPLISTIIPAFNHQDYIADALHSVLAQDYPNLEIILIDDGSQDATPYLAEKILAQGGRPYRLIRQENQGAHAAINRGIELAGGDYLTIFNSDDRYHPARLSILLNALQTSGRRFAFSKIQHIDPDGQPHPYQQNYLQQLHEARLFPTLTFELLRHNIAATTSNFFFQRSLFPEVGLFAPFITCHDWDYLLRVILVEDPVFVDTILLDYRIHPRGSLQLNLEKVAEEVDLVLSNYLKQVNQAPNPFTPGAVQWGAYWDVFAARYMEHLQVYPQVCACLAALSGRESLINDADKYAHIVRALGQHIDFLQNLGAETASPRPDLETMHLQVQEGSPFLHRIAKWLVPGYKRPKETRRP